MEEQLLDLLLSVWAWEESEHERPSSASHRSA